MTTMTDERDLVRQHYFECDGPVDVDIELGSGAIEVRFADDAAAAAATASTGDGVPEGGSASADDTGVFTDEATAAGEDGVPEGGTTSADDTGVFTDEATAEATGGHGVAEDSTTSADETGVFTDEGTARPTGEHVTGQPAIVVEVRHEPKAGSNWGIAGLLNWVGREFGAPTSDIAAEAVRQTTVTVHGNRLTIRGPRPMPLRGVPLAITVHAPAGSSLSAKAGSADIRLGGAADRVNVSTGSGDVSVDRADGPAQVKSGSGTLRLGRMHNGLHTRTGSGDVEVATLDGDGSLGSGSGNIWIGTLRGGNVSVKTGSGDLTVAEAGGGSLQLVSGSGDLRVGIRQGVLAEVDVMSGSGRARTDLPMSNQPPSSAARSTLRVRARTGSGDAVVGRATA